MKFKNLGLEAKIILIVAITLIFSFGVVLFIAIQKERSALVRQYQSKIGLLGGSIITSIQNIMVTGNATIAQQFVVDLKNIKSLESLEVIRTNGFAAYKDTSTIEDVNARLGTEEFVREPLDPEKVMEKDDTHLIQVLSSATKVEYYETFGGKEMYTQLIPLINENRCHGCHGENHKIRGLLKISTFLYEMNQEIAESRNQLIIMFVILLLFVSISLWWLLHRVIVSPIRLVEKGIRSISDKNFGKSIEIKTHDEIGSLTTGFNQMSASLKHTYTQLNEKIDEISQKSLLLKEQSAIQKFQSEVVTCLASSIEMQTFLKESLYKIASYTESSVGAVYLYDQETELLKPVISLGVNRDWMEKDYKPGEGLVGRCTESKKKVFYSNIPDDTHFTIRSILGDALPRNILALPIIFQDTLLGVIELGSLKPFAESSLHTIEVLMSQIAIAVNNAQAYETTRNLLKKVNETNEELSAANEELQAQTEELQAQTEELLAQSQELEMQKEELEAKSGEVEEANRLKSEFLSNMSHELRTPLNSIMALTQLLIDGSPGNINEEQKQYLSIVEKNSKELLNLINDILDISKIEAGKVELFKTFFDLKEILSNVTATLKTIVSDKGIKLNVNIEKDVTSIYTDREKLQQILLNLLGNATKFTEKGKVDIDVQSEGKDFIKFQIKDTGIGIPPEKMDHIFDKFTQVDGSTSRKYGGTGLGLAITKQFVYLLGGKINVESTLGIGSTFTFILPVKEKHKATGKPMAVPKKLLLTSKKKKSQKTILIVDDEEKILQMLRSFLEEADYRVITARRGDEAIKMAEKEKPFAITLDLFLPDMDGWLVLSHLKGSPETSQIPVIIISISNDMETGFALGAAGYICKPLKKNQILYELKRVKGKREFKRILIIDDNPIDSNKVTKLLGQDNYEVLQASSGKEGLGMAITKLPDVIILDLIMPGMDGFEVLSRLKKGTLTKKIPVFILTTKDLSAKEKTLLAEHTGAILQKWKLNREGLLSDVRNVLNDMDIEFKKMEYVDMKTDSALPEVKKIKGQREHVLVVEDNAVAANQIITILKKENYQITCARSADTALNAMKKGLPDAIILDLMLPGMDGFAFLDKLHSIPGGKQIPVLILTAKDLSRRERGKLNDVAREVIIKGTINRENLLDKIESLFSTKNEKGKNGYVSVFTIPEIKRKIPSDKKVILIVEDNKDNLFTLKEIIKGLDCEIMEAMDGETAIELIFNNAIDLVLLDIQLPTLSGYEVARTIRKEKKLKSLPMIALTAYAMGKDFDKCIESGCNDYLAKPVNPKETLNKIKQWL